MVRIYHFIQTKLTHFKLELTLQRLQLASNTHIAFQEVKADVLAIRGPMLLNFLRP
jgi:hypothetical protein